MMSMRIHKHLALYCFHCRATLAPVGGVSNPNLNPNPAQVGGLVFLLRSCHGGMCAAHILTLNQPPDMASDLACPV